MYGCVLYVFRHGLEKKIGEERVLMTRGEIFRKKGLEKKIFLRDTQGKLFFSQIHDS